MRIKGMKDIYRPRKIGRIGLGVKVPVEDEHGEVQMRDGQMQTTPKATDHFVVPPEVEALYKAEPKRLPIYFLMDRDEEVFPHGLMLYGGRGLVCMGDGEKVVYRRHMASKTESQVVIFGGVAKWSAIKAGMLDLWKGEKGYGTVERQGNSVRCLYMDCPRHKPWMCRPTGMLRFSIRGIVRQGYYQMTVHLNPMRELLSQLRHGRELVHRFCGQPTIMHADWLLTLTGPEKRWIETRKGSVRTDVYTPHLELDPEWMKRAMAGGVELPHMDKITAEDVYGPSEEPEGTMDADLLDDLPYDASEEEEKDLPF